MGFDNAENRMTELVAQINYFLTGEYKIYKWFNRIEVKILHKNDPAWYISYSVFLGDHPASLKDMCLNLMVIICTAVDNVSRNTLMEYLMMNSIFESLVHLLSNSGK